LKVEAASTRQTYGHKTASNIIQKRLWLGTAFALGTCVAICSAPIFLWMVGAGVASSLFCTPKEALTVAALSGLAAAGLFAVRRRINSSECGCEDKAIPSVHGDKAIACDLTVFSNSERNEHIALAKSLLEQARQIIEHKDGFTFVFEQSPFLEMQIANWVSKEKRCCPFFSFDLSRAKTPPSLRLRIVGPNRAKEILRSVADLHAFLSRYSVRKRPRA
jgi:hypothetical protein